MLLAGDWRHYSPRHAARSCAEIALDNPDNDDAIFRTPIFFLPNIGYTHATPMSLSFPLVRHNRAVGDHQPSAVSRWITFIGAEMEKHEIHICLEGDSSNVRAVQESLRWKPVWYCILSSAVFVSLALISPSTTIWARLSPSTQPQLVAASRH